MPTESEKLNATSVADEVRACIVAHTRGAMDHEVLAVALKGFALTSADAGWEILSLLDQYHRRGALSDTVFRLLKAQVTLVALRGPSPTIKNSALINSFGETQPINRKPSPDDLGEPTKIRMYSPSEPVTRPAASELQTPAIKDDPYISATETPLAEEVPNTEEKPSAAPRDPPASVFAAPTSADAVAVASENVQPSATTPSPLEPPQTARASAATREAAQANSPLTTRSVAQTNSIVPGKVLNERFAIESALSFGRHTAVFRARDQSRAGEPNNLVALKILLIATPGSWTQFEHEQQIAKRQVHANVVKTYDMHYNHNLPFFTMELIEGNTLAEMLAPSSSRRLRTHSVIAGLVNGLRYLHRQRLAHGDVHPNNVIITNTGDAKLIDFSAAQEFSIDDTDNAWNTVGQRSSTPSDPSIYSSCQRLEGQPANASDDVFSLACIAYELLAGHHPFNGMPATQARSRGISPARIPILQPQQWHSLQRGLAWERANRTTSVEEWFAGFSSVETEASQTAQVPPTNPQAKPFSTASAAQAAAPRWTPPDHVIAPPSPPPAPKPRFRWVLVAAFICSSVAAVAILQSELGFQIRSTVAEQLRQEGIPINANAVAPELAAHPATSVVAQSEAIDTGAATTINNLPVLAATPSSSAASMETTKTNETGITNADDKSGKSGNITPTPPTPSVRATGKQATTTAVDKAKDTEPTDTHGRIGFSKNTFVVSRNARYVPITINRDDGTSGKVTFTWWTESGSAEEGRDFMSYGRKTEVLGNGKRRMTVFVPLIADLSRTKGEVFFVGLGDPSNGLGLGRITRATVVISD